MPAAARTPATPVPDSGAERARREAERILKQAGIKEAPVSPLHIARSYGLEVIEVDFSKHEAVAGFLELRPGEGATIYVAQKLSYAWKAFTIAKELAHIFLHRDQTEPLKLGGIVLQQRPLGAATDPLEKEAIVFAAHLLVPSHLLDKYNTNYATAADLAQIFAVPPDVIRFRTEEDATT